jgi:hypothetical protein
LHDTAIRKERWKLHRAGDHSKCLSGSCSLAGTHDGTRSGTVPPTDPIPAQPIPKGNGLGAAAGSAGAPPAPIRGGPEAHPYSDDGSGLSCEECNLPAANRVHLEAVRVVPRVAS